MSWKQSGECDSGESYEVSTGPQFALLDAPFRLINPILSFEVRHEKI